MPELHTSAWYDERRLSLPLPDDWRVETHWPRTPPALNDAEIAAALAEPVAMPRLAEFASGASRPLIIVDDLTRPTPAGRLIPFLLDELADAGCPPERVTVMIATGSHRRIPTDAGVRKIGREAAAVCRVLIHDGFGPAVRVGRTSFGTDVLVNPEVASSDLVLGVGGVYPQHSTGFGGGAKLAIGVLGKRSIVQLHYRHAGVGGSYRVENDFRRDLVEVARLIGLRWSVAVHVDAAREVVRVICGDHEQYYMDAVESSREWFKAPLPGDADVVISNAYPTDVSLTFAGSKGMIPLNHTRPAASRIVIAACHEGIGLHGIFPFMSGPRLARPLYLARVIRYRPRHAAIRLGRRLRRVAISRSVARDKQVGPRRHPVMLFVPLPPNGRRPTLPADIPGMTAMYEWDDVVSRVTSEQRSERPLRAVVYPCAPLQVLELEGETVADTVGD